MRAEVTIPPWMRQTAGVTSLPSSIVLRDVSLRDGLQDEDPDSDRRRRSAIFEALVDAGVRDLELTSFVRPDRVPALADAEAAVRGHGLGRRGGRVTDVGSRAQRAWRRAGARRRAHASAVRGVGERHPQPSQRRGRHRRSARRVRRVRPPCDRRRRRRRDDARHGDSGVRSSIRSTRIGSSMWPGAPSTPGHRRSVLPTRSVSPCRPRSPSWSDAVRSRVDVPIGVHLHDTRGLAIANAIAALEHGADAARCERRWTRGLPVRAERRAATCRSRTWRTRSRRWACRRGSTSIDSSKLPGSPVPPSPDRCRATSVSPAVVSPCDRCNARCQSPATNRAVR